MRLTEFEERPLGLLAHEPRDLGELGEQILEIAGEEISSWVRRLVSVDLYSMSLVGLDRGAEGGDDSRGPLDQSERRQLVRLNGLYRVAELWSAPDELDEMRNKNSRRLTPRSD